MKTLRIHSADVKFSFNALYSAIVTHLLTAIINFTIHFVADEPSEMVAICRMCVFSQTNECYVVV